MITNRSPKVACAGKKNIVIFRLSVSSLPGVLRRVVKITDDMNYDKQNQSMRNPGIAAVLSFFIPGVGQIYNGKLLRGVFWLIVTPGFWLGTGGMFGWVCHLISAFTAYRYAKKHPFG